MKPVQYLDNFDCAVEAALDVIGGKWKGIILYYLMENKVMRFNEIRRIMPKITQRMLTHQLRELERDGLVTRKVYAEVPPRVEYSLTDLGMSLRPVILWLSEWGKQNIDEILQHRQQEAKTAT
jgi:DNA-binding HxlR family transcriptional regulator